MSSAKEYTLGKYTLVYDMNALCAAEDELGPLTSLLTDPEKAGSVKTIRSLIWAGLIRNHKGTIEEAGDVIDEVGLEEAANAVRAAMQKAYPQGGTSDETGKPKAS